MARLLTPPSPDQPESKQTKPFPLLTDSSKDLKKKKILVTLCYPALNVKQYYNRSPEKCKFWKVHRTFQDLDPVQSHFDVTSQAQKESFSNPCHLYHLQAQLGGGGRALHQVSNTGLGSEEPRKARRALQYSPRGYSLGEGRAAKAEKTGSIMSTSVVLSFAKALSCTEV